MLRVTAVFHIGGKSKICNDIEKTNAAIEDAIRRDFESLPPEFQDKLLDMLCASGCMTQEWWKETLLGPMPSSVDDIAANDV